MEKDMQLKETHPDLEEILSEIKTELRESFLIDLTKINNFGKLIEGIDIENVIELYTHAINTSLPRKERSSFSNEEFEKVSQDTNNILEPHHQFIEDYMNSKYIKIGDDFRTKEQIILELKTLVQNTNRNYLNMSQIVKAGKASNLEEIIECSEFKSTEGEIFLKKLGKSGVAGTTYLVNSPKLGNIAVKVLKKGKYNPKEIEILNTLARDEERLENIVRFIYAPDNQISRNGEKVETIFMEFIDGESLESKYEQNPKGLEEKIAFSYSKQLLMGILDLRRKQIFHRDIHLGNVMVDNLGKLKIVDFGIAENNLNAEPEYNLRHGGITDLVSWAFITYELFTGEHLLYNRQTIIDNKTNIRTEIEKRKNEMYEQDGHRLKPEYFCKIWNNLPEYIQLPVTYAFINSESLVEIIKGHVFGFVDKIKLQEHFVSHGFDINKLDERFYEGLYRIINKR